MSSVDEKTVLSESSPPDDQNTDPGPKTGKDFDPDKGGSTGGDRTGDA